jgi:predicted O-linked N-acetylglucosamine transferase (SPINDLY family)
MGTPFITLAGQFLHARMGANLLHAIGLQELVAATTEEYVAKAVTLAGKLDELKRLRTELPKRMQTSPLLDIAHFTRALEQVFRGMFQRTGSPTD